MLVFMLDFGFRPSFARNISYIFSGVQHLQKEGIEDYQTSQTTDYSLLKGTLKAMRLFYTSLSLLVLVLLATIGTVYIYYLLRKYTGDTTDVIMAWFVLICINCYSIYTMYYEALLTGKGYILQSQKINILGHAIYLVLAVGLIYCGLGLTAIVTSQLVSIVVRRIFSYRVFFTADMKARISEVEAQPVKPILKAIYPNAVKSGLTSIGGFMVNKSSMFIGSIYLPLSLTAGLGITLQVFDILSRCGLVVYTTILPKIAQNRVERNWQQLRRMYIAAVLALLAVFIVGGMGLITFGNHVLEWLQQAKDEPTLLLPAAMLCAMLTFYFLEYNHVIAAGFIMADNRIPFFIPSLLSGAATIVLMLLLVGVLDWGLWGMIVAPGMAQLAYQNWRWPSMVIRELFITHKA
jgi:O-antigen/teichoic acid export membrane protein